MIPPVPRVHRQDPPLLQGRHGRREQVNEAEWIVRVLLAIHVQALTEVPRSVDNLRADLARAQKALGDKKKIDIYEVGLSVAAGDEV